MASALAPWTQLTPKRLMVPASEHSVSPDRPSASGGLFQRAVLTADTDKLRIARFCVLCSFHGFLVLFSRYEPVRNRQTDGHADRQDA